MIRSNLRAEAARFLAMVKIVAQPESKRALSEHSLNLAQRTETISRLAEAPVVVGVNVERYRSIGAPEMPEDERRTVERLLGQAKDALNGHHTLRQLAGWYREFAERAGNPVIWEARLRTADSLDEEAERIEFRNGSASSNL